MPRISPAMQDARAFTNYLPPCLYDQMLAANYQTPTNMAYRLFLQNNASRVAQDIRKVRVCTSFDDKDCSFLLRPPP
jgi:hypothetical protein